MFDEPTHCGQRAGPLVGELRQNRHEVHRRCRNWLGGLRPRKVGARTGEAEVLFDAAGLGRDAAEEIGGLGLPGSVETDQVGDQVEAAGRGLDGDSATAHGITRDLDAGGAGEPVGGLGPFRTGQVAVVGAEPGIEVGDRLPVTAGTGGEWVLQERVFEVLGPLGGGPGHLLVVQGVEVQAGPVGDDGVLGQPFLG
ncbi:hypothetical protein ACWDAO_01730 [Streptomyces sp. NPDC001212]|uniref:hypothetical protein n=1 Tax=Streptomyces sp. NPDC001312 TaxID=3364561 RepID=UPI0036A5B709